MAKRPISAFDSTYVFPILKRVLIQGEVKLDDLVDIGKYNTLCPRMDMLVENGILNVAFRRTGRQCKIYTLTRRGFNLISALILSDSIFSDTLDITDSELKELLKEIMEHTRYASYTT